jgi:hypothetical protein
MTMIDAMIYRGAVKILELSTGRESSAECHAGTVKLA